MRIDYQELAKKLATWMTQNNRDAAYLAENLVLAEKKPHERKVIVKALAEGKSMAGSTKISPNDIAAVAEYCEIDVPYTDKPIVKKSPFKRRNSFKGRE